MKYYKLFIEFCLVSLIVSEILESVKLPASAKLPFLPLVTNKGVIKISIMNISMNSKNAVENIVDVVMLERFRGQTRGVVDAVYMALLIIM